MKIVVLLPATPLELFAALTDSKRISRWSGQKGNVEPNVGGELEMFDGWVKGKVLAYKPGKALAYTWLPGDWDDEVKSTVRYKFTPAGKDTKVILTHEGFPNEKERTNHRDGWYEFVLHPLKEYFQRD
ncbi:MAG: SRPBCC domain-containing protein [Bacteroidota bacterium]